MVLGVGSIIFTILNVIWSVQNKEAKWFSYVSLSLTALTLCVFYSAEANRVVNEDWGGLMDIMPATSTALWVCTIASLSKEFYMTLRAEAKMSPHFLYPKEVKAIWKNRFISQRKNR